MYISDCLQPAGTHHSNAQAPLTLTESGKAAILREYRPFA